MADVKGIFKDIYLFSISSIKVNYIPTQNGPQPLQNLKCYINNLSQN